MRHVCARALLALLLLAPASAAAAALPEPRLKPDPTHFSDLLSAEDFDRLKAGLKAAEDGDWTKVRAVERTLGDASARRLLQWRRAASDPAATLSDLEMALEDLEGWPRLGVIRSEAEAKIDASGRTPGEIIAWFAKEPPRSGVGKVALAEALLAAGDRQKGEALLREAWRGHVLPPADQARILSRHGARLSRDDHAARVDFLLWRDQRSLAQALLPKLTEAERNLAVARIKLRGRHKGVDAAVNAVPSALTSDPGLLYERARWRRRAGLTNDALPLILDIPADAAPTVARDEIWVERRIHIGRVLERGDAKTAYELAAAHGLSSGVEFADAEWLAGWLALRRLNKPKLAAEHFARLDEGVSTPVSRARALYWRGRAAEELGEAAKAAEFFKAAAGETVTYYGQLAAARLGGAALKAALPAPVSPTAEERAAFRARPLIRALILLGEMNQTTLFREFAYHIDDQLERPVDYALFAEIAQDRGMPDVAVRGAKAGLQRGVLEVDSAYPVIDLPTLPRQAPEEALILALMRQESEFQPRAVSRAGARGLMQLMPATAKVTARQVGESFRANWLTDDAEYNIILGSRHLGELVDDFDGSYVLAAAAYNAGASRARRWLVDYGDPRGGKVDPVDWVESLPFSETRNYVQRILENVQVYRARLKDGEVAIELEEDLERGGRR